MATFENNAHLLKKEQKNVYMYVHCYCILVCLRLHLHKLTCTHTNTHACTPPLSGAARYSAVVVPNYIVVSISYTAPTTLEALRFMDFPQKRNQCPGLSYSMRVAKKRKMRKQILTFTPPPPLSSPLPLHYPLPHPPRSLAFLTWADRLTCCTGSYSDSDFPAHASTIGGYVAFFIYITTPPLTEHSINSPHLLCNSDTNHPPPPTPHRSNTCLPACLP